MINPVLRRELKTKLRTWKAPTLLIIYLLILAGFGGMILLISNVASHTNGFDPREALTVYSLIAGCQLGLIVLLVPALTSGSISGERERQTLDLLLITKQSPFSIIIGKLMSSISQIILLILASTPIFSIVFMFGGVSLGNIVILFLFFIATAIMIGSVGIFCSTYFKKTTTSTVIAYLFVLTLTIATVITWAVFQQYSYIIRSTRLSYGESLLIMGANPFVGFLSIVQEQLGFDIIGEIFSVYNNPSSLNIAPWLVNLIFDGVITIILLFLSVIRIQPVMGKRNSKSR
ncbi:MAG: ABC transporter permease [Epulopiscium sp.]|nr:ABC transporter permease [Candidatus Epulonipiscium sp.]